VSGSAAAVTGGANGMAATPVTDSCAVFIVLLEDTQSLLSLQQVPPAQHGAGSSPGSSGGHLLDFYA
jgi:hypothetical protein